MRIINDKLPDVYATNHNYGTYEIESKAKIDTAYTLYDRSTVRKLIKDNPDLLPKAKVNISKDLRWNKQKITSAITQGTLQGEPIDKVANRLQTVTDMNHSAAVRNARTMVTASESMGRVDSYRRMQKMGVEIEQEWLATLDGRTRHSHRQVHLEKIKVSEDKKNQPTFSNGCRFPGDPEAPAAEVYNCRCTLISVFDGIDPGADVTSSPKMGDMTFEEWKQAKPERKKSTKSKSKKSTKAKTEKSKKSDSEKTSKDGGEA
jgi:uncharacterized protein with gpF-like domain